MSWNPALPRLLQSTTSSSLLSRGSNCRPIWAACSRRTTAATAATTTTTLRPFSTSRAILQSKRVAVLYQELEPPLIDGTRKPKKPGGYRDSGADIAYNLSQSKDKDVGVLCPAANPDPAKDADWCFPDTEDGILSAIDKGATHVWANTILFASHPLQTSARIGRHSNDVRVIGQGPLIVEKYDDKNYVNSLLRNKGAFAVPRAWAIRPDEPGDAASVDFSSLPYPMVAKPARGRGSHGVKVCGDAAELKAHLDVLSREGLGVLVLEEYLAGEEATVTVMPPTGNSGGGEGYWSLPVVTRFNHQDGIAPYNGTVAVTSNSRAVLQSTDPAYAKVARECELVGQTLGVTAPIRIDVRRFDGSRSDFALFDVNMKPNMTGPGRPGRDDQASLTLMAAEALGWDYAELLRQILGTSYTLEVLRRLKARVE